MVLQRVRASISMTIWDLLVAGTHLGRKCVDDGCRTVGVGSVGDTFKICSMYQIYNIHGNNSSWDNASPFICRSNAILVAHCNSFVITNCQLTVRLQMNLSINILYVKQRGFDDCIQYTDPVDWNEIRVLQLVCNVLTTRSLITVFFYFW